MTQFPPPLSAPPTTAAGTATLRLTPEGSAVRFSTRHLLGLAAVTGTVDLVDGHVTVDPDDGTLLAVQAHLNMSSFSSSSAARDKAVASSRLLDSARHPRAIYRSAGVERTVDGWLVRGTLTVRGTGAPVDLRVDGFDLASGGSVHATARVDRFAHGVTIPTALAARHLDIDITIGPTADQQS